MTSTDISVAGRIRQRRIMLGITENDFADRLSLTLSQVRRIEQGSELSAGILFQVAGVLHIPVEWFFSDLGKH